MEKQEKELDLLDIIKFACDLINKYVLRPLSTIIKLGLRKWYILLSSLIVALFLSILVPRFILKKSSSEILVKANVSVSTDYINELEAISKLEKEKLSELLDLDEEVTKGILSIRPHRILSYDTLFVNTFIDRDDEFDKLRSNIVVDPKMFALEVISRDEENLLQINTAIFDYLNNKSTFAKIHSNRMSYLKNELETFTKEIQLLDSIRSKKYFDEKSSNVLVEGFSRFYSMNDKEEDKQQETRLDLNRRIINIKSAFRIETSAVSPISTITITKEKFIDVFMKYSLACFILTYVLLILCTYKKEIINWINTDNK